MNSSLFWYAIRTKPRQEKRAAENLISRGIPVLAPRLEEDSRHCESHLFPGYIFARFEGLKMLHSVQFTRGVAYVVSFGGAPATICDEVIKEISGRMDAEGVIRNRTILSPGDTVLIRSGLLRDFVGIFERKLPGSERVQILLNTMAFRAHVEVSRFNVVKLPGQTKEFHEQTSKIDRRGYGLAEAITFLPASGNQSCASPQQVYGEFAKFRSGQSDAGRKLSSCRE